MPEPLLHLILLAALAVGTPLTVWACVGVVAMVREWREVARV